MRLYLVDITWEDGRHIERAYYAMNSSAALDMALADYPDADGVGTVV